MTDQEPMPLCDDHSNRVVMPVPAGACPECGRTTNATWLMCGWCAEERQVCVLHGTPAVKTMGG